MIETSRILVVDDYEMIRKIHVINLKKLGIKDIHVAVNGQEAVEAVERKIFDLILMDWYMPIMTGIEALKVIRKRNIQTPILLCIMYPKIRTVI